MNLKESLLQEKELLIKRLKYIDDFLNKLDPNSINLSENEFPLSSTKPQKVLWLFENIFDRAVRFLEVQEAFNHYNGLDTNGKQINLEGTIRGLKKSGKLVIVKYNKSNKLSFWGLNDWVNEKGLKNDYIPKDYLPNKIESIEVIK